MKKVFKNNYLKYLKEYFNSLFIEKFISRIILMNMKINSGCRRHYIDAAFKKSNSLKETR